MPAILKTDTTPNIPSDDEIKEISVNNRALAAEFVVRKYREPLFRHARYILKDSQLAADVCQEVFIKALREGRFFNEDFKMKAWLYRVTSNLCFNRVRDRRRRSAILETIPKKRSTDADQVDVLFGEQQQKKILDAMDRLSDNHRKILMLRYYSDLSYAEIAEALDIKLGTVMSRLSRAKQRLMEVLDDPRVHAV